MENQNNIRETIKNFTENKRKEKGEKTQITLEIRIIGWAGTILIITAYSLNSLGYLDSQSLVYPILNLGGAFLMAIRIWVARNWSNFILEIFWAAIAIITIIKWFFD